MKIVDKNNMIAKNPDIKKKNITFLQGVHKNELTVLKFIKHDPISFLLMSIVFLINVR